MDNSDNDINKKETHSPHEPTPIQHNSTSKNREASIYAKSGTFDATALLNSTINNNNNRKGSTSSTTSNSGPSFTQRLIERGVAVPNSFSGWSEKVQAGSRSDNDSSSPGSSFDFDNYYGMSPFITPSFNATIGSDGPLYKSLRHRYEKEKSPGGSSVRVLGSEDDDDSSELVKRLNFSSSCQLQQQQQQEQNKKKQRSEDSDIELSDDEIDVESNSSTPTQEKLLSATLTPLNQRPRRSRSPLAFSSLASKNIKEEPTTEEEYEETPTISIASQKLKNFLITKPTTTTTMIPRIPLQIKSQPKPLPNPPRRHLLQTPVFQVINANTVKDRYLFLFNDLLLICKPIMDENIIVSSSQRNSIVEKNRYRFRPNENSLFQVKNIVQLGQLTLYISKEDYFKQSTPTTIEIGPDGRPILPPPKRIHPVMASALRKFETNANLGIQYLVDKGVLLNEPPAIANFLFKTPDLNRRQLGYYLSEPKNSDVYDAFLECFRLVGLRLDEALRILLTTFRLPSNWEALEYLIERFAKKWHDANQNVIKFHEDMVVKVVVAMLFLNAECWYDATSERDVFWYARELKERQDRQAKRKMSVIDYRGNSTTIPPFIQNRSSTSATTTRNNRQSVTAEPLHYISALRAIGNHQQPCLEEFLSRWNYYDQYELVPHEFMEEMYKSITEERLETGWDNKTGRRIHLEEETDSVKPKIVSPSIQQGSQDVVITVTPYRLPHRLTKGIPSDPITISIPTPDKGLQIKLRGQDLIFEPNILDFTNSCIQTFTITGNTLGRTSLMFIKAGENAGNYVSPTLPRTKSVLVERPFMRYTFQIGFKHIDHEKKSIDNNKNKTEKNRTSSTNSKKSRKQQQQVEQEEEDVVEEEEVEEVEDEQEEEEEEEEEEKVQTARGTRGTTGNRVSQAGGRGEGYLKQKELLLRSSIKNEENNNMVNRKYTFSVETEQERIEWLEALEKLSGQVNETKNEKTIYEMNHMNSESRVALQVLKEVLLADEIKKGTARTTTTGNSSTINGSVISKSNNNNEEEEEEEIDAILASGEKETMEEPTTTNHNKHGRTMNLLLPQRTKKKGDVDRNSIKSNNTTTTANVVTKRGYEIVKLVVQNSMVPLVLGFLVNQIQK